MSGTNTPRAVNRFTDEGEHRGELYRVEIERTQAANGTVCYLLKGIQWRGGEALAHYADGHQTATEAEALSMAHRMARSEVDAKLYGGG